MCGICGIYHFNYDQQVQESDLLAMMARLIHRGPDAAGLVVQGRCGLGVRRLSIIDPLHGSQPVTNETQTVAAVCNGEIYNFQELRQELAAKGHRFNSNSDAEVLPHLYEEFGADMINRLEGMFAVALYDATKNLLLLARDRFGMKPLFYFRDHARLIFASELKAIKAIIGPGLELNNAALLRFFTFEFIPAPETAFKRIHKLLPAQVMTVQDQHVTPRFYWKLEAPPELPSPSESLPLQSLLNQAVASHSIADVPLGLFLSGGVDSSVVLSHLSAHNPEGIESFTITFKELTFSEGSMAASVAERFHARHYTACCEPTSLLPELAAILTCVDEPFADASLVPTYLLARLAAARVKVALSGEGGDEIFGGYLTYQAHLLARYLTRLPVAVQNLLKAAVLRLPANQSHVGSLFKLRKLMSHFQKPPEIANTLYWGAYPGEELSDYVRAEYAPLLDEASIYEPIAFWLSQCPYPPGLQRIFFLDLKLYLHDGLLMKVDHAAMANSLEVRLPYLDRKVVEAMMAVPAEAKVTLHAAKKVLLKAYRAKLPAHVLNQPKRGFDIPLDSWLRGPWKDFLYDQLSSILANQDPLLTAEPLATLLQQHESGRYNHRQKLWTVLCYALWRNSL